eukprot:TRINITY_DN8941_c0_g1_i2.p1 TRINITY_DN8941_c0_g1~~TRINITY_DN8941_c0_g1_i2.p1  ORF type:complete len:450 (+),score=20.69 TRINITY_DN8941_c0_g1_i2:96-1352(+)
MANVTRVPPRKAARLSQHIDPSPGLVESFDRLAVGNSDDYCGSESNIPDGVYGHQTKIKPFKKCTYSNKLMVTRSTKLTEPQEFQFSTDVRISQRHKHCVQPPDQYIGLQKFCEDFWRKSPQRIKQDKLCNIAATIGQSPKLATSARIKFKPPRKSTEELELEKIAHLKPFKAKELNPKIYSSFLKNKKVTSSSSNDDQENKQWKQDFNFQTKQSQKDDVIQTCSGSEVDKENCANMRFQARPIPVFNTARLPKAQQKQPIKPQPFCLATEIRHQKYEKEQSINDNKDKLFEFKALPLPMTTFVPQIIKPKRERRILPQNVALRSDVRAQHRMQYNAKVDQKNQAEALKKKYQEHEALKQSREQLKLYRKTLEFKAQPLPDLSQPDFLPDYSKSQQLRCTPILGKHKRQEDVVEYVDL